MCVCVCVVLVCVIMVVCVILTHAHANYIHLLASINSFSPFFLFLFFCLGVTREYGPRGQAKQVSVMGMVSNFFLFSLYFSFVFFAYFFRTDLAHFNHNSEACSFLQRASLFCDTFSVFFLILIVSRASVYLS